MQILIFILLFSLWFNAYAEECSAPEGYSNYVDSHGVVHLPHVYYKGEIYRMQLGAVGVSDKGNRTWELNSQELTCGFSSSFLYNEGMTISLLNYQRSLYMVRLQYNEEGLLEVVNINSLDESR